MATDFRRLYEITVEHDGCQSFTTKVWLTDEQWREVVAKMLTYKQPEEVNQE